MRIAVVSDIHGNRTAFEAVLADLRQTAPDLIFHGGDLVHGGASSAFIVDQIRDLGWPGVLGNTDEMLWMPESLTDFARRSPHLQTLFTAIEEMAQADREALGDARLAWLRGPGPEADNAELKSVYEPLGQPIAVYGHIHRSYIRRVSGITVINTGSVSLSYDGDPRDAYLLLDDTEPTIRRVEYDVDRELKALAGCGLPHAAWKRQAPNAIAFWRCGYQPRSFHVFRRTRLVAASPRQPCFCIRRLRDCAKRHLHRVQSEAKIAIVRVLPKCIPMQEQKIDKT